MPSDFSDYYSNKTSDIDDHWFLFSQIQFDWILNQIKSLYSTDDHFTVIDLGCGTGRMLSMIADDYPNAVLHGVDGTPEMIKKSQERLKNRSALIQADLNDYAPPHHYDIVISTTVMHHLIDPSHHLSTIKNALNTNGHVFVSEFSLSTLPLKISEYVVDINAGKPSASMVG